MINSEFVGFPLVLDAFCRDTRPRVSGLLAPDKRRTPREGCPYDLVSKIANFLALELKLQFVCDKGDEFRIGGFSFGIGHGIAEEPLEGIQIATVPGHLDGMTNRSLKPGWDGM